MFLAKDTRPESQRGLSSLTKESSNDLINRVLNGYTNDQRFTLVDTDDTIGLYSNESQVGSNMRWSGKGYTTSNLTTAPKFTGFNSYGQNRNNSALLRDSAPLYNGLFLNRTALNTAAANLLISGQPYEKRLQSEEIQGAFGDRDDVLDWSSYFDEYKKNLKANDQTGREYVGDGLISALVKGNATANIGKVIAGAYSSYDKYIDDTQQNALNFLSNENREKSIQQAQTDTDPNVRNQVANYEGTGQNQNVGGFSSGAIQGSQTFNDRRRVGWGQVGTQGV